MSNLSIMNPTEQLEQVQNELMCSICYDYFLRAFTLSCSHSFCFHCITAWRNNHHDCPICRSPIYSMAPSRALDNMVATFNGDQYRGDLNNEPIVIDDDENDPEDVFYDGSYASSNSSDIADGDDDYVADVSSVENDDRVSEDLNSQEDEYDPEIDYYDSETDANPASPDDSYLVDDVEDAVSSSPLHDSDPDVYESDDDSLYEYSYPSTLFLSLGMKSLQHW